MRSGSNGHVIVTVTFRITNTGTGVLDLACERDARLRPADLLEQEQGREVRHALRQQSAASATQAASLVPRLGQPLNDPGIVASVAVVVTVS